VRVNSEQKPGTARRLIYFVFSLGVTVGVFAFLFRNISLREVVDLILNSHRGALVLFVLLSLTMSVLRTWRYSMVLNVLGHVPSRVALYLVVLVRNFFSDLLPARLGTLIYVYIVTSRLGVPFGAAAASFALAFLFDIIALVPLLLVAALCSVATAGVPGWLLVSGSLVVAVVSLSVLFAMEPVLRLGTSLFSRLPMSPEGRCQKLFGHWQAAEQEIHRAKEAGIYWKLLLLSAGVRVFKYTSLYVLLVGLVMPLGYTLSQLSIPRVFVGLCASELAASLPISGIAGFGAYEGTWALVFDLLGFKNIAQITSVSHHLVTQVYGYGLGVLALLVLLLPVFRVTGQDEKGE